MVEMSPNTQNFKYGIYAAYAMADLIYFTKCFFSCFTRIQQNRPAQNTSSCRGIRLANIADGPSASPNKKPAPNSNPFRASPFELTRSINKRSSLLDSDSDSDEEPERMGPLGGDPDSDMELDEPEPSSVSMATGITHDHPYAWALDGRVAGSNEGNGMPGHIHVSMDYIRA